MTSSSTEIIGGTVVTPYRTIADGSVCIAGDKIVSVQDHAPHRGTATVIDASGLFVSPGFIDLHIHGGGGHDFMDATEAAFVHIGETHAQHGTTSMMPTTLSSSQEQLIEVLEMYLPSSKKNVRGSKFIGAHLEGPYFAQSQRGAQDPAYIRNPERREYEPILIKYPFVKRWSAAPELPGALEFAQFLLANGVLPALAHTDAVYEEVIRGFESGFTLATHLYSGMSGMTRKNAHRYAGAIESAFIIEEMDVEIIADGVHLPPPFLQMIHSIKKPGRIALITDAMRAAAMPEGESILGGIQHGFKVIVEGGVAKLPDRSSFAGSTATADRLVRTMVKEAGVNLPEVIRMISSTPARIMGMNDRIGSLVAGKQADIVLFDEDINVQLTMIDGRIVFATGRFQHLMT